VDYCHADKIGFKTGVKKAAHFKMSRLSIAKKQTDQQ
jgi:hypothetical protein